MVLLDTRFIKTDETLFRLVHTPGARKSFTLTRMISVLDEARLRFLVLLAWEVIDAHLFNYSLIIRLNLHVSLVQIIL